MARSYGYAPDPADAAAGGAAPRVAISAESRCRSSRSGLTQAVARAAANASQMASLCRVEECHMPYSGANFMTSGCMMPGEADRMNVAQSARAQGRNGLPHVRGRNEAKLSQLHDRLLRWLPSPGSQREMPLRHFHVGVLLVHIHSVYDLLEGLQVHFVWRVMRKDGGSSLRREGTAERRNRLEVKEPPPELIVARSTVALSSDLAQLEVHHSHEVNLVPLTHLIDIYEGPDGGAGPLDDWCVIIKLCDDRQITIRLLLRSQVKPFIAVVLSLAHLAWDYCPEEQVSQSRCSSRSIPSDPMLMYSNGTGSRHGDKDSPVGAAPAHVEVVAEPLQPHKTKACSSIVGSSVWANSGSRHFSRVQSPVLDSQVQEPSADSGGGEPLSSGGILRSEWV
mmetsp:Transcript_70923/g.154079  ORF Transcript_70923/g.154079 Transcript_70923/m.154079 type:complete len:394 (-) Transcript_70923:120-1301(-)